MKIENFEKKKRWRGSYPHNLAWIHPAVSEKLGFTDDGRTDRRTTDACSMTVALLTKSSRGKNARTSCTVIQIKDTGTFIVPPPPQVNSRITKTTYWTNKRCTPVLMFLELGPPQNLRPLWSQPWVVLILRCSTVTIAVCV